MKANLWLNGITQSLEAATLRKLLRSVFNVGHNVRETAFDGGSKLTVGGAQSVAYGYDAAESGQKAQFFSSMDPAGHPRESRGGYVQGTYTICQEVDVWVVAGAQAISA